MSFETHISKIDEAVTPVSPYTPISPPKKPMVPIYNAPVLTSPSLENQTPPKGIHGSSAGGRSAAASGKKEQMSSPSVNDCSKQSS